MVKLGFRFHKMYVKMGAIQYIDHTGFSIAQRHIYKQKENSALSYICSNSYNQL